MSKVKEMKEVKEVKEAKEEPKKNPELEARLREKYAVGLTVKVVNDMMIPANMSTKFAYTLEILEKVQQVIDAKLSELNAKDAK